MATRKYLSMDGLLKSVANNQNNYCTACFSGNYPIKIKEESGKEIF